MTGSIQRFTDVDKLHLTIKRQKTFVHSRKLRTPVCALLFLLWPSACDTENEEKIGHPNPWDSVYIDSDSSPGAGTDGTDDTGAGTDGFDTDADTGDTSSQEKPEPMDGPKIAYTFDESNDGFSSRYFSYNAAAGTMDLDIVFEDFLIEQGVTLQINFSEADLSGAAYLQVLERTTEFTSGGKQLFIQTGSTWRWCSNWSNHDEDSAWDMLSLDLSSCPDIELSDVRAFGLKVSPGLNAPSSQVTRMTVDAFYIIGIDEIPAPQDDTATEAAESTAEN